MATFKNTATGGENAIEGVASTGRGIVGFSNGNYGVSGDSQSFAGVRGTSNFSRGVEGWSTHSEGVFGITKGGVAAVWGLSDDKDAPGVVGTNTSINAAAVAGTNSSDIKGTGVLGMSQGEVGVGVEGYSTNRPGVGVLATSDHGVGLWASSPPGAHAAVFKGLVRFFDPVFMDDVLDVESHVLADGLTVRGTLSVLGHKSVIVPHRDGTHRRLYCMESPECWFEDFGEASLQNGVARVKLEREFAALVKTGRYHVFLSSYDSVQLYVSKRSREGFEIRALPDASGKVRQRARCAYRIVARRKDVRAPRLAKVKIPAIPKRAPFPKFLKSPVLLSKRTHDQFAALRKAHRKRLREVKRLSATAGDIFGAPAKAAQRLASSASR